MTGIYSTAVVLWAFKWQIMRDGKEAACQSAVARITAFFSLRGKPAPGPILETTAAQELSFPRML